MEILLWQVSEQLFVFYLYIKHYLYIFYFCLCWVFTAARDFLQLFLDMLHRLLSAAASLLVERGL